jgi:hypothetical protein
MDDPTNVLVDQEVSDAISKRCAEEKRKEEIRQEMKMADARAKMKNKNVVNDAKVIAQPSEIVQPTKKEEISEPIKVENGEELVTKQKLVEVVGGINKSFAWLEKFIQAQNTQNAKVNKFISDISKAIEEYNKK